jgi:RNA polymerase sigma-70 factor (ECF subfamily)
MTEPHQSATGSSLPSSATSRSLLQRVQANEVSAWEQLVRLYAPLVWHWCRQWDLQEQDAADVFQEVFLAVALHVANFRKERAADTFRGWLRTITRNKILDHFRRRGHEPGGAGGTDALLRLSALPAPTRPEERSEAEDRIEGGVFYRALEAIRGEFEPRTWQAFWQTVVEDRVPRDVAAELSMSPGAVRVAKSRVLQRLRKELGDLRD